MPNSCSLDGEHNKDVAEGATSKLMSCCVLVYLTFSFIYVSKMFKNLIMYKHHKKKLPYKK